jgi:hypothetical protein
VEPVRRGQPRSRSLGRVLAERDSPAERQRGLELLTEVRDMCLQLRFFRTHLPVVELCAARERATYAHFRERYRDMARTLGFKGHIAWAEAMP